MKGERLQFPDWQTSLQETILESDPDRLGEKIKKASALIAERMTQVQEGTEGREEQKALKDALTILKVIQRERIGRDGKS